MGWIPVYSFGTGSGGGGGGGTTVHVPAVTQWLTGSGTPSRQVGKEGDFYLQTTGEVYQKVCLFPFYPPSWVLKATAITGPKGQKGEQGLTGPAGPVGPQGVAGIGSALNTDHFIVGQGGQTDTDLTNKIVIPGLSASPDIRVAGASDDEFDTTQSGLPTGWTQIGSPTSQDVNTTVKSHYYVRKSAASGQADHGIYKSWSPSAGGTVTCKLSDVNLQGQSNKAVLFVGEATPGKLILIGVGYNDATAKVKPPYILVDSHTTPTTGAAAILEGQMGAHPPIYFRITYNSSTSIDYSYSAGGFIWNTVVLANNPGFTVGSAGIFVTSESASFDGIAVFDWIRFA